MLIAIDSRGRVLERPSEPVIGAMLADLNSGEHMILERQGESREGDWYMQVWFRDDDTYQLEYRDGVPAEHYQTRTVSQEKVLDALLCWVAGERDWREGFTWDNIGHWFTPGPEGEDGPTAG
ncbi:hypothetical protein ACYF6T_37250 [Streptomyces sp. 7R007]